MTIDKLESSKCTGCGLCFNICPVKAIDMAEDKEGFLHPHITARCINCGKCAFACPQMSGKRNYEKGTMCYAVRCDDQIRAKCSSGGVFKALADNVLKNGGVVCGAGYDNNFMSVRHIIVKDPNKLDSILASKYVQSDTGVIYKEIADILKKGKKVLFCGCPCQVDALKTYIKKDYENLITVDLLCHGAPSPAVYRKMLVDANRERKKITAVRFRHTEGWGCCFKVDFSDGTSYYEPHDGAYMKAFLEGYNMRPSCYHCQYSAKKRVGDITLGDFWGVRHEWNDGKGTSLVILHTLKGAIALNQIRDRAKLFEPVSEDEVTDICKKTNGAMLFPTQENKMRKCFFTHFPKVGVYDALRYAKKSIMDVGILGWWIHTSASNYGSTLTAFALERYCASLGLSTAFISPPGFDRETAGSFNKKYNYRMTMKYEQQDMWKNNKFFNAYIVGSDVLWYYDAMMSSSGYNFMLDFADEENRKISYSTSFGNTKWFFPTEAIPYAKKLLKRFDFVSCRENNGVKILKEKFDINATQVVDPVFLCDISVWKQLAENAERKTEGDFIFSYFLDPTSEKVAAFKLLAEKIGCKPVCVTDRQYNHAEKAALLKDCGIVDMSIEEFIYHLMNAKFVLTDSFHGTCFSLVFQRDFYAFPNTARDVTRFNTLSDIFDIEDRMITDIANTFSPNFEYTPVNYDNVSPKVQFHTERSKKWLKNALFSKISGKPTSVRDDI